MQNILIIYGTSKDILMKKMINKRCKMVFEKILLSRRMEYMEKALSNLHTLYKPQEELIEQATEKLNQIYNPETKIKFYTKCLSSVEDVNQTMDNIQKFCF